MFRPFLRTHHGNGYTLRRGERFIIHMLRTGYAYRDGAILYASRINQIPPQGKNHFSYWENQDKSYPDTSIAWEVAYE